MTTITIRRGDTLSSLAQRHNTTVERLAQENNIQDPNRIRAGATLRIPGSRDDFGPPRPEARPAAASGQQPAAGGQQPAAGGQQPAASAQQPAPSGDQAERRDAGSRPGTGGTQAPAAQRPAGSQPDVHVNIPFMSQWNQPNPSVACFRTAKLMTGHAGARDAGPGQTMWTNPSRVGRQATPQEMRSYIDGQLNAGRPVIVGVDRPGGTNQNHDNTTDHWVAVTGRGTDEQGRTYYTFHDPGSRSAERGADTNPNNRLYVDERTGQLSRPGGNGVNRYTMTAVRTNANSPGRDVPAAQQPREAGASRAPQTAQRPQARPTEGSRAPQTAQRPQARPTEAQGAQQPGTAQGGRANDLSGNWQAVRGRDPNQYDDMIRESANRHGVPPRLLKAMMQQESHFDPNAVSSAGARGLIQIMPDTWRELGGGDPFDPRTNIDHAAKYMGQLLRRYDGNVERALAAYNWGMGNLARQGLENAPSETRNYIRNIMNSYNGTSYR